MEIVLIVVLLAVLIAVVIVGRSIQSGLRPQVTEPTPVITPVPQIDPTALKADLSNTVAEALNAALLQISNQARQDREESIRMATDLITKASNDQLGARADVINSTMLGVKSEVAGQLKKIDDALNTLRESSATQYGNMEQAVKHWTIAASAGQHNAMHVLRTCFVRGAVSRESINSTLVAYNNSCTEVRSEARDAYLRTFLE